MTPGQGAPDLSALKGGQQQDQMNPAVAQLIHSLMASQQMQGSPPTQASGMTNGSAQGFQGIAQGYQGIGQGNLNLPSEVYSGGS